MEAFYRTVLAYLEHLGVWAPLLYILLYIAATVLFLPGSFLTLAGGVLFGTLRGTLYVSLASTSGAALAFLLGRYLVRERLEKRLKDNEKFQALRKALLREGGKIVLLTRLSPVLPFNLLNYALGLTPVPFLTYLLASWVGMLPGTVLYVYLGAKAGDLLELAGEGREKTLGEWLYLSAGILVTLFLILWIPRLVRRALENPREKTHAKQD